MGFDWPASPLFFGAIVLILLLSLWFHAQGLIKGAPTKIAFRLILLRIITLLFLFLDQQSIFCDFCNCAYCF